MRVNLAGLGSLLVTVGALIIESEVDGDIARLILWPVAGVSFIAGAVLLLRPDHPHAAPVGSGESGADEKPDEVDGETAPEAAVQTEVLPAPPEQSPEALSPIRRFLKQSPEEVAALYEGKTTVQGDALFSIYKDQWMKVDGNVRNVVPLLDTARAVNLDLPGSRVIVHASFRDKECWPHLDVLSEGELIRVEGQLVAADRGGITLDYCELSDEPPVPSSSTGGSSSS